MSPLLTEEVKLRSEGKRREVEVVGGSGTRADMVVWSVERMKGPKSICKQ
jgi:hypothetical protein